MLLWGNQLTVSSGESSFDFPTVEGVRGMLGAVLSKYTSRGVEKEVLTPLVSTVPFDAFSGFMESTQDLNREELMSALDVFVGQHLFTQQNT